MVRLMLTLTPIVCILSAIAFSETFNKYLLPEEEEQQFWDLFLNFENHHFFRLLFKY